MFTSLTPARLELNPLLAPVSGAGSSGLRTGSVSCFSRLVVSAPDASGAGAGAAAGCEVVGTTGTLVVSSGNGFDSVGGFCAGCCCVAGGLCCDDCATAPAAQHSPHP